jgi:peptidoglycan/LPS O-acetylase OafA/YrhL
VIRWWRRLDRRGRLMVAAGHVLAAASTAAIVYWWQSYAAQYVVSNVLPPSVWTLVGIAAAQLRTHAKLEAQEKRADERHDDMKQHVTATAGGSDGGEH